MEEKNAGMSSEIGGEEPQAEYQRFKNAKLIWHMGKSGNLKVRTSRSRWTTGDSCTMI